MDIGGGVEQSLDEVPAGNIEFYIFSIKYNLIFQAGLVVIEVGFNEEHPDDKAEPLEMEHFHLPLGLWLAGLVVSTIFLLAEMIAHRSKQSKRKVPTGTQEEPGLTKTTPELEDHNSDV